MQEHTEDQLTQIAVDLFHGRIYTDRHVRDPKDIPMVFMPVALMNTKQYKKLEESPPGLLFEYLDKAGPRGVNGMPSFFSCQMLSMPETDKVFATYKKLKEAEEAALKS